MVVALPDLTEDFHRVTIISAVRHPPDIQTFDLMEILKLAFMAQDIRLAEDMALGDIVIIDVQKGTPAHAAKFTLPFFQKVKLGVVVSERLISYWRRFPQISPPNEKPHPNSVRHKRAIRQIPYGEWTKHQHMHPFTQHYINLACLFH